LLAAEEPEDSARRRFVGRLWLVGAAILWSTSSFYVKNAFFDNWPLEQRGLLLAFWRALFAGLLLLPLARRPRVRWGMLPLAISFVLMNTTYLSAMTLTTAGNAIWLQSTAPVWVFLVGLFVLKEPATRGDLLLLAFGSLGVGLILSQEMRGQQQWGVSLGLASGFSYAGVVIFLRRLRNENTPWLISLMLLTTAAVLFPYVYRAALWPTGNQFVLLACFGLLQMGLPYVMFAHGLRSISSQEAAGIGLLEPVLVPVWVLASEPQAWWTWVGGALILAGLLLRYVGTLLRHRLAGRPVRSVEG
jgi:drug/metabolite transporter (DMT)-like permease